MIRRLHGPVKFGVVGVVNTGVYYALYLALQTSGLHYLLAHVTATLVAMVGSYFLNCLVTFRVRPTWRTFLLFPLSNIANFVITTVGMRLAVGTLGADPRWAPLPVALLAVPITYLVAHHVMIGGWPQAAYGVEPDAGEGPAEGRDQVREPAGDGIR